MQGYTVQYMATSTLTTSSKCIFLRHEKITNDAGPSSYNEASNFSSRKSLLDPGKVTTEWKKKPLWL